MGVSDTALTHSKGNQIFIETCKRLGQDIHVVPQNTNGQNVRKLSPFPSIAS